MPNHTGDGTASPFRRNVTSTAYFLPRSAPKSPSTASALLIVNALGCRIRSYIRFDSRLIRSMTFMAPSSLLRTLGEGLQRAQLLTHHDEVAPRQAVSEHEPAESTGVADEELHHDARPVGTHGLDHVRGGDVAEQALRAGGDSDVAVSLEGNQPEDAH